MTGWAVRLPGERAASLGLLRLRPGLEVLERDGAIWLRGPALDDELLLRLRALPGAVRFTLDAEHRLVPAGRRLARGRLPLGEWRSLRTWLEVELPPPALPAATEQRVALTLTRAGATVVAPNALRLAAEVWRDWAETAPRVRLRPLRFAVSADGRVLICGTPLPPLPGTRAVEREGIVTPCGWRWLPAVEPAVVRACLRLAAGDMAWLDPDGGWELLPGSAFVAGSRSAVRASLRRGGPEA